MPDLSAHGDFSISWQGNILFVHASGNYNLEGAERVNLAIKESVIQKGITQWVRIDVLEENVLGGPDVLEEVKSGVHWGKAHGCTEVIFITDGIKAALFKKMFSELVTFSTVEEALDYLR